MLILEIAMKFMEVVKNSWENFESNLKNITKYQNLTIKLQLLIQCDMLVTLL